MEMGVSQFLNPLLILEETVLDYNLYSQSISREYAYTYKSTTNTTKSQTVGTIALGLTGNLQDSNLQDKVHFFSLVTGHTLKRAKRDYRLLKIPENNIRRMHTIGRTLLLDYILMIATMLILILVLESQE